MILTRSPSSSLVFGCFILHDALGISITRNGGEHGNYMDCGRDVPLCGVLTLESGLGKGTYSHPEPVVHGLWPETDKFGTSQCKAPRLPQGPSQVHTCYNQERHSKTEVLKFETHEWQKHGTCAGVGSEEEYFEQVCSLSAAPLRVLTGARQHHGTLAAMVDAMKRAGYSVHSSNPVTSEIQLSACAGHDGRWKLVAVADFSRQCGGSSIDDDFRSIGATLEPFVGGNSLSPAVVKPGRDSGDLKPIAVGHSIPQDVIEPHTTVAKAEGQCIPNKRGPKCESDNDCSNVEGCVRCAKSGYCTNIRL